MLRKFSNTRTLEDNIKLGTLTAFVAGMVNIGSFLIFSAFVSNITGHFAILAAEMVKGNWYQIVIVFSWIFLFFLGCFISNFIIINCDRINSYVAHAVPITLEIICLMTVGIYGQFFYTETLTETELLLSLMLFSMGLQNGLTASISNFAVKTTHLTGIVTDLGILFSMFTHKKYRNNIELKNKAKLLSAICAAYLSGALLSGFTYVYIQFKIFYIVSSFLVIVIIYDLYKIRLIRFFHQKRNRNKSRRIRKINVDDSMKHYPIKVRHSLIQEEEL